MEKISQLLENNAQWREEIEVTNPGIFDRTANQQSPEILWIGCADSRVPPNQITGLAPGEIFVHRNSANLVVHSDLNCLAVIQYAVQVLKVTHIVVCGHYGCGGVKAALSNGVYGLIDNWLAHIKDVYRSNEKQISDQDSDQEKWDLFCELNVMAQVANVCQTTIVQGAWDSGQPLSVHGLIYNVADGQLKDLHLSVSSKEELGKFDQLENQAD